MSKEIDENLIIGDRDVAKYEDVNLIKVNRDVAK